MSAPLEMYSLFCQLVNKVLQQGDQSSEQEMNKTESAQFKAMCAFKYSSLGNYNITQKCSWLPIWHWEIIHAQQHKHLFKSIYIL